MTSPTDPPVPSPPLRPSVAVIIPTLNEASTIASCLEHASVQYPDEIVVVDAKSSDETVALASRFGTCRVLIGQRNRGQQQNLGAEATCSDILLFLHADCRLDPGAIVQLRRSIARAPRAPGGCFRMRVDSADPRFRPVDAAAHLRAGVLGIPYGDQGLFVTRWAFHMIGGFPPLPFMDDLFLALRLRRLGRLLLLRPRIHVSPRRWLRSGVLRQSASNWFLTAAAAAGFHPRALQRHYPTVR